MNANETSAQMDRAIQNGFDWLIKTIYKNYDALNERVQEDVLNRNEAEQKIKLQRQRIALEIREK
jgi:hypothetical protein